MWLNRGSLTYPDSFFDDVFGRKDEVDAAAGDGGLGHAGLAGRVELLGDGDTADALEFTEGISTVAVEAGKNDGDELAGAMVCQRTQKNSDYVGPAYGFGDWFETEVAVEDMQIPLGRNDEDLVGLDVEDLGHEMDRHGGVLREDLVEMGWRQAEMIDD